VAEKGVCVVARLAAGVMLAALLFVSSKARPIADQDGSAWLQPITLEDAWASTKGYALAIVGETKCRNLLFALTGQDPVQMLSEGEFLISIPDAWPSVYDEYAAITTCTPPMISIRRDVMMVNGPFKSALVLVHELSHVGTCSRMIDGQIPLDSWEEMAQTVDEYCFRTIGEE